jgi:hypothetical protein
MSFYVSGNDTIVTLCGSGAPQSTWATGDKITARIAIPISGWDVTKQIEIGVIPAMYSAEVYKSSAQSLSATTWTPMTWDTEVHDDNNISDLGTYNTRLTVPAGCDRAIVIFGVKFATEPSTSYGIISKNGVQGVGDEIAFHKGSAGQGFTLSTGITSVVPGDYFVANSYTSNSNSTSGDENTKFSIVCWNSAASAATGTGGMAWEVISTNTNAVTNAGYLINASSGAITLTLMASPSAGNQVGFSDYYDAAETNTITIARNGNNINGVAADLVLDVAGSSGTLVYGDATMGWKLVNAA